MADKHPEHKTTERQTSRWRAWLCAYGIHILPRRWSATWIDPARKTQFRACACGRKMIYAKQPVDSFEWLGRVSRDYEEWARRQP